MRGYFFRVAFWKTLCLKALAKRNAVHRCLEGLSVYKVLSVPAFADSSDPIRL